MLERIRRLTAWVRGISRTAGASSRAAGAPENRPPRRFVIQPCNPPHSPYARGRALREKVVDGDAVPLVRPYLVAYEQEERRTALALALDGVDVGPWIIHGVRVGTAR